jgi:hypothetical protein
MKANCPDWRKHKPPMWNAIGAVAALAVAAVAWLRSRSAAGGFYDEGVYGMAPAVHRRYALASAGFAIFFAAALVARADGIGLAVLGIYAVVAILYASSFLRGASDDHE